MRKITSLLMLLCVFVVTAWGQGLRPISHQYWTVTALNEAGTSGNEGGVAFIKDDLPATFYHSNWGGGYEGGTTGKNKGQDGVQAFMIEMPWELSDIKQITYAGRSDNNNTGWVTKARIYVFQTLPEAWPKNGTTPKALSALTYAEKEALLGRPAADATDLPLGEPAFDNYDAAWSSNREMRTATFATSHRGKYVLFVMDESLADNGYLTCSDFQIYQAAPQSNSSNEIAHNTPYYLKVTNSGLTGDWYVDVETGHDDTNGPTIAKSTTPVAAYLTYMGGAWHISSKPGHTGDFLGVNLWCAAPSQDTPADWWVEPVGDGSWYLRQSGYTNDRGHYLGYQTTGNKLYTDNPKTNGIKVQFIELDAKALAAEKAKVLLAHTGVGYPASDSPVRTALQTAIDAEDATAESIHTAIDAFLSADAEVVLPEAGKVYRIYNGLASFATRKSLLDDNGVLKYGEYNASAQNQMWTMLAFETEEHAGAPWTAFQMMNLGTAKMPQSVDFNTNVTLAKAENDRCSWNYVGSGQFRLYANRFTSNGNADGQSLYADGVNGGQATGGNVKTYNAGTNPGEEGVWYMEEVAVTRAMLGQQIADVKKNYALPVLMKPELAGPMNEAIAAAENVYNNESAGDAAYAEAFSTFVKAVNTIGLELRDVAYVYMKSKQGQRYAYNDGNALKTRTQKDYKSLFRLTRSANGGWNIQSGNGRYAQNVSQSALVQTGTSSNEYYIEWLADEDYYTLRPASSYGTHQFWHQDGSSQVVGWATAADNTRWAFETLSDEEVANVYTVTFNSDQATTVTLNTAGYTGNQTVEVNGGFYVMENTPQESDFTVSAVEGLQQSVSVDGNNILVRQGYEYKGGEYYVIRCRKDNPYVRYHASANSGGENMLIYQAQCVKESVFALRAGTGDYEGFYTISPIAAPDRYVYNLGTVNADSKVATRTAPEGGVLTGEYYWKLTDCADGTKNITPYHTGGTSGDAYGWNKRGSNGGYNHIGYWQNNNNTNDNKWYVHTLDEEFPIPTENQYDANDAKIGLYTNASVQALKDAAKVINDQNLATLQNRSMEYVMPKAGKFYRIKNNAGNAYLSCEKGSDNRAQMVADADGNKVEDIFYMAEDGKFVSYKNGQYFGYDGNFLGYPSLIGGENAATFRFSVSPELGKLYIWFKQADTNGRYLYSDNAGNTNAGGTANTSSLDGTAGYRFTVEEVKYLPVRMDASVGYATLYSPVNLRCEDGGNVRVQAYIATTVNDAKSSIKMVECTDGIPANEAVILKYVEGGQINASTGCVYLPVTSDEIAAPEEGNQLVGTFAAANISDDAYVLANKDNKVAFYMIDKQGNTTWKNNGFKAYLPASVAASRFLNFDFGDIETGIEDIEGAEGADANTVIYDLSGRRVQNAQKGIYIINGKKVIK